MGGPLIAGVMIFCVVHALGELAVMYPVSGGFYTYSVRFIDPSWGFAMGWNYVSRSDPWETCLADFLRSFNGS
jgi:amino acid permease